MYPNPLNQKWTTAHFDRARQFCQRWLLDPAERWKAVQLRALKLSWHKLTRDHTSSALTLGMLVLTLLLPAGFSLAEKNVQHLTRHWREGTAITAYLNTQTTPEQARVLAAQLLKREDVRQVQLRTPNQQQQTLQRNTGLPLRAFLPKQAWPYALRVYPNLTKDAVNRVQQLSEGLRETAGIDTLQINHGNLSRSLKLMAISEVCLWLACLLACVLMGMKVLYTIRAQMRHYQDEIQLLSELGARRAFIRREYQYMGLILTLLAAVTASMLITLGTALLRTKVGNVIHFLDLHTHVWMLLGSIVLGWLGARIASLKAVV